MFQLMTTDSNTYAALKSLKGVSSLCNLLRGAGDINDSIYDYLESCPLKPTDRIYLVERIVVGAAVESKDCADAIAWRYDVIITPDDIDVNQVTIIDDNEKLHKQCKIAQRWQFVEDTRYSILCLDMLSNHYWASTEGLLMVSGEDASIFVGCLRDLNGM